MVKRYCGWEYIGGVGEKSHCMMPRGCNAYLLLGEKIARVCEFDMFSMKVCSWILHKIMYCIISSTAMLPCLSNLYIVCIYTQAICGAASRLGKLSGLGRPLRQAAHDTVVFLPHPPPPMHRNVMTPMSARRLGACINNATKHNQVRRLTTSRRWQQTASEEREHKERLAVLQAEDLRLLQPVKTHVDEYLATVGKAKDMLENMPAALQPILSSRSVHSFPTHRLIISEALASAKRLQEENLPNLLAHLEDLEVEDYPEPGNDETELQFLARVKDMNPAERRTLLDTVNGQVEATTKNLRQRVQNWSPEEEEAERSDAERFQTRNPLPSPSTEEQFANVISDATAKLNFGMGQPEDVRQWKPLGAPGGTPSKASAPDQQPAATVDAPKPKPKTFGFDLNSLQAKLEASIKKVAKR